MFEGDTVPSNGSCPLLCSPTLCHPRHGIPWLGKSRDVSLQEHASLRTGAQGCPARVIRQMAAKADPHGTAHTPAQEHPCPGTSVPGNIPAPPCEGRALAPCSAEIPGALGAQTSAVPSPCKGLDPASIPPVFPAQPGALSYCSPGFLTMCRVHTAPFP